MLGSRTATVVHESRTLAEVHVEKDNSIHIPEISLRYTLGLLSKLTQQMESHGSLKLIFVQPRERSGSIRLVQVYQASYGILSSQLPFIFTMYLAPNQSCILCFLGLL